MTAAVLRIAHRSTGISSALRIVSRHFAIRQYPEQAETEPSTKIAKSDVALTALPARREASGQPPDFVASGRPVEPLQDALEIEVA